MQETILNFFQVMDAVSVVELKSEKCPRVCGADILELLAQKRSRSGRAKVLVVDVRTSEEYPFYSYLKKQYSNGGRLILLGQASLNLLLLSFFFFQIKKYFFFALIDYDTTHNYEKCTKKCFFTGRCCISLSMCAVILSVIFLFVIFVSLFCVQT